jgi:sugar lactone lactonase YvrE|tara:strand:+ start:4469 stop:5608 length:1140 start_codon:yes stop_codon:yes gene_type:complete
MWEDLGNLSSENRFISDSEKKIALSLAVNCLLGVSLSIFLFIIGCAEMPDIEPVAFTPEPAPKSQGALEQNNRLTEVELLAEGLLIGPEDVALDEEGLVYTSEEDGAIRRILHDGSVEEFVQTGGRPLGLAFDLQGNLVACDPGLGLISVSPTGKIDTLVALSRELPLHFPNDLDIAPDGRIYFSDVTSGIFVHDTFHDILVHRPFGRLLRYDPSVGVMDVVGENLYYANGVTVGGGGRFVLVTELGAYRVTRFWLKGERSGERDVFADNLPGYPDGIMADGKGNFWLAIVSPRNRTVDEVYHPRVWIKKLLMRLPDWLRPGAEAYGFVLKLNHNGEIVESLHDPSGKTFSNVSNVIEKEGKLYLASLYGNAIGVYHLP